MGIRNLTLSTILACSVALAACSQDYGKTVEQGRAVAFTKESVTFVKDVNVDPKKGPKFENSLRTFALPSDPKEVGPEPVVGNLIDVNVDKKELTVLKDGALQNLPLGDAQIQKNIESHNAAVKGKAFPIIENNKVTVYIKKTLVTFSVPAGCSSDKTFWTVGDMVRVFSTEEGKARRFMNISKTNIFKK